MVSAEVRWSVQEVVEFAMPGDAVSLCHEHAAEVVRAGVCLGRIGGEVRTVGGEPGCEVCGSRERVWWWVLDESGGADVVAFSVSGDEEPSEPGEGSGRSS